MQSSPLFANRKPLVRTRLSSPPLTRFVSSSVKRRLIRNSRHGVKLRRQAANACSPLRLFPRTFESQFPVKNETESRAMQRIEPNRAKIVSVVPNGSKNKTRLKNTYLARGRGARSKTLIQSPRGGSRREIEFFDEAERFKIHRGASEISIGVTPAL